MKHYRYIEAKTISVKERVVILTLSVLLVTSIFSVNSSHIVQDDKSPHIVVALFDTGINPYHEIYRRPNMNIHPSRVIDGFPEDAIALNLTFTNSYQENLKRDQKIWSNLSKEVLYWIPGTNIFTISFGRWNKSHPYCLDMIGHGTGTSSVILQENPDALYSNDSNKFL